MARGTDGGSVARPKHVIFDLDGTLVDSAHGILDALGAALAACDVHPTEPLAPALIGPPLKELMARVAGTDDARALDALMTAFKKSYDSDGCTLSVPYPGIEDALQRLSSMGHVLYLATNKRARPTQLILENLQWTHLFCSTICGDSPAAAGQGKTAIVRELLQVNAIPVIDALLVGDSVDDLGAALVLDIGFVGVTWGYGSASMLANHSDIATVSSPEEL